MNVSLLNVLSENKSDIITIYLPCRLQPQPYALDPDPDKQTPQVYVRVYIYVYSNILLTEL